MISVFFGVPWSNLDFIPSVQNFQEQVNNPVSILPRGHRPKSSSSIGKGLAMLPVRQQRRIGG